MDHAARVTDPAIRWLARAVLARKEREWLRGRRPNTPDVLMHEDRVGGNRGRLGELAGRLRRRFYDPTFCVDPLPYCSNVSWRDYPPVKEYWETRMRDERRLGRLFFLASKNCDLAVMLDPQHENMSSNALFALLDALTEQGYLCRDARGDLVVTATGYARWSELPAAARVP